MKIFRGQSRSLGKTQMNQELIAKLIKSGTVFYAKRDKKIK